MSGSNWSHTEDASGAGAAREIVAGYFANPQDATNAIHELMDEGFSLNQIGVAYHSGPSTAGPTGGQRPRSSSTGTSASFSSPRAPRSGQEEGSFPLSSEGNQELHPSRATSDTEAVSPWRLFTGGGTPFAGASRPGPITGSEVPSDLPRDLPSDLAQQGTNRASGNYAYSSSAFEKSFTGMGIPPDHARRLTRELQRGGAIVTVKAGPNTSEAEAIVERNHGTIRYESAPLSKEERQAPAAQPPRVDVFGEVHRVYPGYIPGEDLRRRKAS